MIQNKIPSQIFDQIKKNVPLSCVDAIVVQDNQFLLVKRKIPPYKNKWCLPGGIIKRGQKIIDRLNQVGIEELGIGFIIVRSLGFYEKIYRERHDITHCFIVNAKSDRLVLDFQASQGRFFKKIPKNTASFHIRMLKDAGFR
jgi:8-oxo-dGTP diphosphatase